MSKKILTLLAPVVALIAFAMVPALAQATSLQAPAGTKLTVGKAVSAQSENLTFTAGGVKLQCTENTLNGELTATGGEHVTVQVTNGSFRKKGGGACATDGALGSTAHIKTNLQGGGLTPEVHWTLQVQQPEPTTGQVTAHLTGDIRFQAQIQSIFGGSVDTCGYQATSIQFMGTGEQGTASSIFTVEGANQFTRTEGGELCAATGTLSGSGPVESGVNGITVDH